MKSLMLNWKSTANGILAFFITSLTIIASFLGASNVNSGNGFHVSTKVTIAVTIALALCRAWVGLLEKDSGNELALKPGSDVPVVVPAHETPNDPAAVVVVPKS